MLGNVNEVICVALNYKGHRQEVGAAFHEPPYQAPPKTPVLFIKPKNTIVGHLDKVQCPDGVEAIQPGPALAVVIGKDVCRVDADEAMNCISGYTLFNDFTLPERSYFRPPITSKCFDSFGPLGPEIVAKEKIADPHQLAIQTFVNGELRQQGNTSELLWRIPALVAFISSFKTLFSGEVIATGFPAGRVDVSAGDEVSIEIAHLGRLTNLIVSETEYYAA